MIRHTFLLIAVLLSGPSGAAAQTAVRPSIPPKPSGAATESSASATVSLAEYDRLHDLAERARPAAPPVAAVLSSATLRVRVDGTVAHGNVALAGDVLQAGPARLTIISNAAVLSASSGGRPLPLVVNGSSYEALLPGPGPFGAELQWGAALIFKPGQAGFVLPVPAAGTARATIDVPGEQADVRLSAGAITRRTSGDGRTVIDATLDPGSSTEVWWSMRDAAIAAPVREARTTAEVMTLLTIGDSDVRMVALIDLTVLQGEPRTVDLRLPAGYQLTGISGSSVAATDPVDDRITVTLADPSVRHHQLLVALERPHQDASFSFGTGFVDVLDVQRERGEAAIEGIGTLDLDTTEDGGVRRIDVRELNATLRSLARTPLLSAYRYQRTAQTTPGLAVTVTRFSDSAVLAASVDNATATTLITGEGRALTEVTLHLQNHAQPFMKVRLPAGARIVSVEVAGQPAKPVTGSDGSRVPLLRPGFRPDGAYDVSYVYLHEGSPFARKGRVTLTLPQMDIPVGVVSWEVFAPGDYALQYVGGNAIRIEQLWRAVARGLQRNGARPFRDESDTAFTSGSLRVTNLRNGEGGHVSGIVRDTSGEVLPGVTVSISGTATLPVTTTTNAQGHFAFSRIPKGVAAIEASLAGFNTVRTSFAVGDVGLGLELVLGIGSVAETVTVAAAPVRDDEPVETPQHVVEIQQRVAGVLPIPVDVPRAGVSHRFERALVLDDDTYISFEYKRR